METKSDDSPLTKADLASHRVIVDGLSKLTPDVPIISEESSRVKLILEECFEERGVDFADFLLLEPQLFTPRAYRKLDGIFSSFFVSAWRRVPRGAFIEEIDPKDELPGFLIDCHTSSVSDDKLINGIGGIVANPLSLATIVALDLEKVLSVFCRGDIPSSSSDIYFTRQSLRRASIALNLLGKNMHEASKILDCVISTRPEVDPSIAKKFKDFSLQRLK